MSGQLQSFFEIDEDQTKSNMFEKVLAILNKLKIPFLFLLIFVSLITLGVKVSNLESEADAYQRKLTFHSRAASAEDCQELRTHGFSTSGHFLIDPDGRYSGKPAFEVYCDFDKNLTRVSPTSGKSENDRLTLEYDDQLSSLVEHSGMCYQYVSFASDKCLNVFWWEDNRGLQHWFRDNDELKVSRTMPVRSDFLPIRAIGPPDLLSCNTNEVIVEDLICSDIFNIDIKGPLNGLNGTDFKKRVKNWGETFDIEFDIILDKKYDKTNQCGAFVYVTAKEFEEDDFEFKVDIMLCPNHKLAFESSKKDKSRTIFDNYALTPNVEHHIQYKQFRQHDYNGELKRFVKIDNEIVLDRQVNFTSVDATVHVGDVDPYGSISNFKMSK